MKSICLSFFPSTSRDTIFFEFLNEQLKLSILLVRIINSTTAEISSPSSIEKSLASDWRPGPENRDTGILMMLQTDKFGTIFSILYWAQTRGWNFQFHLKMKDSIGRIIHLMTQINDWWAYFYCRFQWTTRDSSF